MRILENASLKRAVSGGMAMALIGSACLVPVSAAWAQDIASVNTSANPSGTVASSIQTALATNPGAAATIVTTDVSSMEASNVSASVIGGGIGQAVAALASSNPDAATALVNAAAAILNSSELAAFSAATAGVTINGQSVASLVLSAQNAATAALGGGGGFGGGFAGGSSTNGSGGNAACVPTPSRLIC